MDAKCGRSRGVLRSKARWRKCFWTEYLVGRIEEGTSYLYVTLDLGNESGISWVDESFRGDFSWREAVQVCKSGSLASLASLGVKIRE